MVTFLGPGTRISTYLLWNTQFRLQKCFQQAMRASLLPRCLQEHSKNGVCLDDNNDVEARITSSLRCGSSETVERLNWDCWWSGSGQTFLREVTEQVGGQKERQHMRTHHTHTLSLSLNVNIYLGKKTPGWCPESGSLQEFSVSTLNKNKTGACVQKLSLLRSQLPEISQTSSLLKGSATLHSWDFWSQKTLRACS